MKRNLSILFLSFFMLTLVSYARTLYNPDNTIKYSNSIRTQREVHLEKSSERTRIHQGAAAAKINYEEDINKADTSKTQSSKK